MTLDRLAAEIAALRPLEIYGRVASVQGMLVEVAGPVQEMSVGARLSVSGFAEAARHMNGDADAPQALLDLMPDQLTGPRR